LFIPVLQRPQIIESFLHDTSVQDIVFAAQLLTWNVTAPRVVAASLERIISAADYPVLVSTTSGVLSSDGKLLATIIDLNTVQVTDIATNETIRIVKHENSVRSVAFSPDGTLLATASWDKTAKVTNIETNETVCIVHHNSWVRSVSFSPDGKLLATGSWDKTAKVTDIATESTKCVCIVHPTHFVESGRVKKQTFITNRRAQRKHYECAGVSLHAGR
jgi:WD40 repeat protein